MPAVAGSEPIYTVDWTTQMLPMWREQLAYLHALPMPKILEIGAFEGRTTRWLLETFPRANVTVVDPFTGGSDQHALQLGGLAERFRRNTRSFILSTICARSANALPDLLSQDERFDFIYIDGSHEAADVLFDLVCAYRLLADGGSICCDDYIWQPEGVPESLTPKAAITAFHATHQDRVTATQRGVQVWIRRTA